MHSVQEPEVRYERMGACDPHEVLTHPAYGVITLSNVHGNSTLFGSDIKHSSVMRIAVRRGELHRSLSNDSIRSTDPIIEFELSHAQFAQFITATGRGDGTPCTLRYVAPAGVKPEMVPGIQALESKHETFRREIRDLVTKRLAKVEAEIARLGSLIESGKFPKSELRELHHNLSHAVGGLPNSISFVVEQAEEALEKATSDAKIEVEAFIGARAQALGLQRISDLSQLEYRQESAGSPASDSPAC